MPRVRGGFATWTAVVLAGFALVGGAAHADETPIGPDTTTAQTTDTIDTTSVATETAAAAAVAATLAAAPAPASGCPEVGAVGLLLPQRPLLVLAPMRLL